MKQFAFAFALVWSYQVVRADEAPTPSPAAPTPADEQHSADEKLLNDKLEELQTLQAEVNRLKGKTHHAASILFQIRIAEVSRAKWTEREGDSSLLDRLTLEGEGRGSARGVLSESGKKLFDKLRAEASVLKVIAEPAIMTIADRPASMHVGGEIAVPHASADHTSRARYLRYGTSVDIVPIVVDDQTLRLELRLQLSCLDYANSTKIDGQQYPGIVSRQIDFATEVPIGQTLVVVLPPKAIGARSEDDDVTRAQPPATPEAAVETVVLVTPRWVDPMVALEGDGAGRLKAPVPPAPSPDSARSSDDAVLADR